MWTVRELDDTRFECVVEMEYHVHGFVGTARDKIIRAFAKVAVVQVERSLSRQVREAFATTAAKRREVS